MKKAGIILITIMTIILMITGCGTQYLGGSRIEKWQKDLNYLKESLPKKHADLFARISESEFNNEIDQLKDNLDDMSDEEIENGIYKIAASIGDAHTKAYINYEDRLPVIFYYFGDDLYLINTSSEYEQALNCRLIAVDGMQIRDVESKLKEITAQANEANIKKTLPSFLGRPDILKGAKIINDEKSALFTFQDNENNIFELEVKAVANSNIRDNIVINDAEDEAYPLYRQHYDLNYWLKYLDDYKLLYFKYNCCLEDENSGDIQSVIDKAEEYIDDGKVEKVVIDMRNNSGGTDGYLTSFIDKIKNSKLNNPQKFFVIVGRETFSSAIIDSCNIRQNTNAEFLGEPTSGTPRHYGARKSFDLPNSKMQISYSTTFINISDDYNDSFIPDKIIEVDIDDYTNKRDPILDYIENK